MKLNKYLIPFLVLIAFSAYGKIDHSERSNSALIIIDMQDYFVERGRQHEKPENQVKTKAVNDHIIDSIKQAKQAGLPIVLLEYEDSGPTNDRIKEAVGDYDKAKYITKNTDSMFDSWNRYRQELNDYLEKEKVSELLITGANGGACVHRSIRDALYEEYKVVAYSKGIADFNYRDFIYPYDDQYGFDSEYFEEVDDPAKFNLRITAAGQNQSKVKSDTAKNDGARRTGPSPSGTQDQAKENGDQNSGSTSISR